MEAVFLKIINMSITASWIVLAVIILRLLLKKAPKWIMGILWGIVAIRLIVPFSLESVFSLIPNAEPIPQNIFMAESPAVDSGFSVLNEIVNPIISNSLTPNVADSVNPIQVVMFIGSVIWLVGAAVMLVYTLISYLRIHNKVQEAVQLKENIWICDHISTPFILGVFHPRIYLPSSMNEADMEFVVSHEKAHLKRKDYIWKPLGFLLLSAYWFNPLLWVAYILLCKDIELACDEKVLGQLGTEMKKPYSNALINCSVPRKMISACPLAFGETGVKERVKGVLSYKKPAFWIIIAAVTVCIVTAVCLLTNPKTYDADDLDDQLQVFLDMQIKAHHQSDQTDYNYAVLDYDILKVDKSLSDITLYMWVLYEEYSYKNGNLQVETGSHIPTVITVTNTTIQNKNGSNSYKLKEYWEPRDGSYYESDIKEKFPKALWSQAFDSQRYITKQEAKCSQAARDYFNAEKETEVVYEYQSEQDSAKLTLSANDNKCTFSFSMLSSYFAVGTYEETNKSLVMKTDDEKNKYTFRKEGNKLIFVAAQSTKMPKYAYSSGAKAKICVPDGAAFEKTVSTTNSAYTSLVSDDEWGISMNILFKSEDEFDIVITHSSKEATIGGTLTTSPEYEIRGRLQNGETIPFSEYMQNVLNYDYLEPERAWEAVLYIIKPNGTLTMNCYVTYTYGSLPAGNYVLCKPITLTKENGESVTKVYTVDFEIPSASTDGSVGTPTEIQTDSYPV